MPPTETSGSTMDAAAASTSPGSTRSSPVKNSRISLAVRGTAERSQLDTRPRFPTERFCLRHRPHHGKSPGSYRAPCATATRRRCPWADPPSGSAGWRAQRFASPDRPPSPEYVVARHTLIRQANLDNKSGSRPRFVRHLSEGRESMRTSPHEDSQLPQRSAWSQLSRHRLHGLSGPTPWP